ncbi:hypothetical protein SELMODRAFT_417227 [Selaginella moellendorffii]|uniref:Uncharacterized protein n=1 Tax=Selaginella moellendorffii TaxID=88036 RepID=D8S2J2_SELML|nr:hypothetical protein SELMODRAFT_417227 [Selaginella moellendorffii]
MLHRRGFSAASLLRATGTVAAEAGKYFQIFKLRRQGPVCIAGLVTSFLARQDKCPAFVSKYNPSSAAALEELGRSFSEGTRSMERHCSGAEKKLMLLGFPVLPGTRLLVWTLLGMAM